MTFVEVAKIEIPKGNYPMELEKDGVKTFGYLVDDKGNYIGTSKSYPFLNWIYKAKLGYKLRYRIERGKSKLNKPK